MLMHVCKKRFARSFEFVEGVVIIAVVEDLLLVRISRTTR